MGACSVDHNNACNTGYLCNGGGTDCNLSCAGDSDCAGGYYCDKAGTCQPQKDNGGTCNLSAGAGGHCKGAGCRECKSGSCVDGYCCDQACGGQCQACDVAGHLGACYPVSGVPHGGRSGCTGSVSDPQCSGSCAGVVGNPASQTACAYPNASVACGSNACSSASLTTHGCGNGTCSNSATTPCATGYVCASSSACAAAPCTSDAQCDTANDYYCNLGSSTCVKSHNPGTGCDVTKECKSGTCHLCTGSNVCAFGVCCESACSGDCQMCNASGKCVTAGAGQPLQGRPACPSGQANCGASCDGTHNTCQYASSSVVCGGPSCSTDHTSSTQFCSGTGKCNNPVDLTCGAQGEYACLGGACNDKCGNDKDCASTPFQWKCNLVSAPAKPYCAYPNGHGCDQDAQCGSGSCSVADKTCCDVPCNVGSNGTACGDWSWSTQQFLSLGTIQGACKGGKCSYVREAFCGKGFTCNPKVGLCFTKCACAGPKDPNGLCDSDQCDRAGGHVCDSGQGVCR